MPSIISRRHPITFYLILFLGTLFFLGLGTLFLSPVIKPNQGSSKSKDDFLPLISLLFYLFAIYNIFKYYKNAPNITLDKDKISFNGKELLFDELKEAKLTGKQSFNICSALEWKHQHFILKMER